MLKAIVSRLGKLPFENQFVYYPSRKLVATPEDYGLLYQRLTLTTPDGLVLMAWAIPAAEDAPWLIYFHGNGENVSRYLPLTTRLHALGLNILTPDYRGYGESEGKPSEMGLYCDAQTSYQYLLSKGVVAKNIILYGFSLGSGVAIHLAAESSIGALIVEAGFTSVPDVAKSYSRFIPAHLMKNRFTSKEKLARVDAPLLFLHSPQDRAVPFAQGKALFALAPEPKEFVELSGSHIGLLNTEQPGALEAIQRFIKQHL